jgi:autotransporter translocation and assembly factor TamB
MVWVRRTRLTLLVGLLSAMAVLAWLAAHPATYAGQLGRIITDNLLRKSGAAFTFETLSGNPLRNLTFYDVSITRPGEDGSFVYLTADSLAIDYDLKSFFSPEPHLRSLVLGPSQLLLRLASGAGVASQPESSDRRVDTALRVDFASVDRLNVSVATSAGDIVEELRDLQWIGSARTSLDQSVKLHTARLAGAWPTRSVELHRASFDATLRGRRLELKNATADLDSTRAEFGLALVRGREGGVESFELDAQVEAFSLNEILALLGKDPGPRLQLAGSVKLDYAENLLRLEGAAHGRLDSYPITADQFSATIDSVGLHFDKVDGSFLSARGQVRGSLDFSTALLSLEGDFTGGDLSEPWTGQDRQWPACELGGRIEMQLVVRSPLRLDLDLSDLRGDLIGLPVEAATASLHFDDVNGLEVKSADARVLDTDFHITGTVDAAERVELALTFRAENSDRWEQHLDLPLGGQGLTAAGRLFGSVDSLALRVGGSAEGLQSYDFASQANFFILELPRFDDLEHVRGQLRAGASSLRGIRTGALRADFLRAGSRVEIDRMRLSSADSSLEWSGGLDWSHGTPTLRVDSLIVDAGTQRWRLEQPAHVELFDDGVRADAVRLRSDFGRIELRGTARRDTTLDFRVAIEDADLASLHRLGLLEAEASGDFDADLQFAGSLDSLVADFWVNLTDATLGVRQVGDANVQARVRGARIDVSQFAVRGPVGALGFSGTIRSAQRDWPRRLLDDAAALSELWETATLDLAVHTDTLATSQLLDPSASPLRFGLASSDLQLRGTPLRPRLSGDLEVEKIETSALVVPRLKVRIESDDRGVHVQSGTLAADEAWLQVAGYLPLDLSLVVAPRWNAAEGLRLRIWSDGETTLAPFRAFWPMAREFEGRGEIQFLAEGDPAAPRLSGHLRVRDGRIGLRGWSEVLRDTELDAHFVEDRLVVDRLEGREGAKGRVSAAGEVIFRGLLPDDVWADFRADRVLLASVPYLRAVGSSTDLQLRLRRPSPDAPRAPHLTGTVSVDKAIYTGEFAATGGGSSAIFGPNLTPLWTAEIAIRAREQVRISNQSAELRVQGDVDLIRDTDGLRFRGTAEIPRGRVPLFNNDFSILSGGLDFSRRPLEPEVDITAETEVPIYDAGDSGGRQLETITIHLTGTFAQPTVAFTSENGLDENSILRLLAGFGGPSESTTVSSGVSDVGLRAGLNFLERALAQRVRGVDTIDIETEEVGVAEMQSTRIAVGKYLSESLYLRLSQGLSITERDIFLEYQISRRLLFTSELRRRLRENGAENEFNVDMKFRVKY